MTTSSTPRPKSMHIHQVLPLQKYGIYAKLEKCSFDYEHVEFSRYLLGHNKVYLWINPSFKQHCIGKCLVKCVISVFLDV